MWPILVHTLIVTIRLTTHQRKLLRKSYYIILHHPYISSRFQLHKYCTSMIIPCGLGSTVGIVTGYGLDSPGIESRWGARFSAPVQTGPGAHPASCTMGTRSFPGVKTSRGVSLTPHTPLVLWSWKSRAIHLLPLWAARPIQSFSACTRVHFTLPYLLW